MMFVALKHLSHYEVCLIMMFVGYDICRLMTFVALLCLSPYYVCCLITFFGYDVCCLMMLVTYEV